MKGEVLDILVQRRRDQRAALKRIRKLLKRQGYSPTVLSTDRLLSYGAASAELRPSAVAVTMPYGRLHLIGEIGNREGPRAQRRRETVVAVRVRSLLGASTLI